MSVGSHSTHACCCVQPDGTWLRFDDTAVYHVPLPRVLQEASSAYLLFYELA